MSNMLVQEQYSDVSNLYVNAYTSEAVRINGLAP